MVLTIEYDDGVVREWHATADGVEPRENTEYTPTIYASTGENAPADALDDLEGLLQARGDVAGVEHERWCTAFRNDPESVLRIDPTGIDRVRPLAGWIRRRDRPGTYRLYNVDLTRGFRYCLEAGLEPVPERALRSLELTDPTPGAPEAPIDRLVVDFRDPPGEISGELPSQPLDGSPADVLDSLTSVLATYDPDVLVCSSAALVPALFETAEEIGRSFQLGRGDGYEQLAGTSTYESYGQVGHSPARYDVPGRVLLDQSNTFFFHETNLAGCLDLVERSHKPLQELSWASIGNVLTAIQIRTALDRGVLVPWKSWRHELPKTARQLHDGDRGGFTFSPEVGVHDGVHELDFSSLYPNIIRTRNVSPETVRCDCHADRQDVPGLGYSICDDRGYLPDVLAPIIEDRDAIKDELARTDDPERRATLTGQSDALKWILVACFGYQGFSNAKFGRIECHEAINAFARELLLDAKAALEAAGWQVVHGIVDSLWVTARPADEQRPLDEVAGEISEATEIRLEHEGAYDWIAFAPLRDSDAGALTRYFGRRTDGSYKYRGIECRQRSTPAFVADCQRELIEVLDRTRDPERACDRLAAWIDRLDAGTAGDADLDTDALQLRTRASKSAEAYEQSTRTAAALRRRAREGIDHHPGQDVQHVVVDDDRDGPERVRLPHEDGTGYDAAFYRDLLVRAAASVCSPFGWRREQIEAHLAERTDASLSRFCGE